VPVEELENEDVDFSGNGCAKWQSEYPKEGQKAAISNTFIEGDWGQSTVLFEGMDTVRIARGAAPEKNQPISDGAYWFDSAGLLRGVYVQPQTTVYRDFGLWDEKQIPRKMEVVLNGKKILTITIEQIETARDATEPSDFQQ
jgi:hypothetical protein